MQTQRRSWKFFQRYTVVSFVVSFCIASVLVISFFATTQRVNVKVVHAQPITACSRTQLASISGGSGAGVSSINDAYSIASMQNVETMLSASTISYMNCGANVAVTEHIALLYQVLKAHTSSAHPAVHRQVKVRKQKARHPISTHSARRQTASAGALAKLANTFGQIPLSLGGSAAGNVFPFGQCTWWANQRYYQLHGIFVPWTTNANAAQWTARALDFGWHVSASPLQGSIIVLQAGVQGAYALGHVGVVEQVLANGYVIVSSMNWGDQAGRVVESTFSVGPGVSFISL